MGQKSRLLEVYFENPDKEFTIRDLSKISKLPRSTVHKYLNELKNEKLITGDNLQSDSLSFRMRKITFYLNKIIDLGLVESLVQHYNPSCIILFGSVRKGDSTKESDIDIFLESQVKKEFDVSRFEKKLEHKLELFIEPDINKLPNHLFNNVINGIKLYGEFKIK